MSNVCGALCDVCLVPSAKGFVVRYYGRLSHAFQQLYFTAPA